MSNLRDEVIRAKTLSEMNYNSMIEEIRCDLDFIFEWSGKSNCSFSDIYTSEEDSWPINKSEANSLISSDKEFVLNYIKDEYISRKKIYELKEYKNVSYNVFIEPTIYYKIKFYDGKEMWLSEKIRLTDNNSYHPFFSLVGQEQTVYTELTEDNISVSTDDYETELTKSEYSGEKNDLESLLLKVLEEDKEWVSGTFGKIKEDNSSLRLPIKIDNVSKDIIFNNPQDTNSDIWDLTEDFGYDDPWNLQNEPIEITVYPTRKNYFYKDLVYIRPKSKSRNETGLNLKEILNNLF